MVNISILVNLIIEIFYGTAWQLLINRSFSFNTRYIVSFNEIDSAYASDKWILSFILF